MHVLQPGQPNATTPGLFPVHASSARAKMRQKYRALRDSIERVWAATVTSDVEMHPGHFHIDCEQVVIDTAAALVVIRTIDTMFTELLTEPAKARYQQMLTTDTDGRVVRGLVLVRNADVHAQSLIEMDSPRLVSGDPPRGWRVFPRWQEYASLPAEIQNNTRTGTTAHDRYQDSVGGRLVIETLLDVMRFLDRCDPTLARRTDTGDLEGFPLTAFIEHDYERRHPYWPNWAEMDKARRDRLTSRSPHGTVRQIRRSVPVENTNLLVCWTDVSATWRMSFIESTEQVARDIAGGFPYTAATKSGAVLPVALERELLTIDGEPLDEGELADAAGESELFTHRSDEWLASYWETIISDGSRYRQHRRPSK